MTFLDEVEIRSLLARERFARDTGQWVKLRNCYHPDPTKTKIDISWYLGDINGFVFGSEKQFDPTRSVVHQIMPVEVDVRCSKALVQSLCTIDFRFDLDGGEYDAKTYTRIINQCEKVEGSWKLLTLDIIYVRDSITPVYPAKDLDYGDLSNFRKSYRFTAWTLQKRGFLVRDNLPGIDEPKSAEELLSKNQAWIEAE